MVPTPTVLLRGSTSQGSIYSCGMYFAKIPVVVMSIDFVEALYDPIPGSKRTECT